MRQGIHPEFVETSVSCSCGNTFVTRSVKSELHVELCDQCHPFYTGKQKLVDTGGRVERFKKKYGTRSASAGGPAAESPAETSAAEAPAEASPAEPPAAPAEAPAE